MPGSALLDLTPLRVSPPFRWLFAARTASLLVYGVQALATSLQVYDLTRSATAVGVLSLASAGAMAVSLVAGGLLADRADRKAVILAARSAYLVSVLVLLGNALRPEPDAWPILAAAAFGGFAGGISLPALMAVTPALVGRENLLAAASLGSVATQVGAIGGPAAAGLLVGRFGFAACYAIVAAGSALTVVLLSRLPDLPRGTGGSAPSRAAADFREGLAFVLGTPLVLSLLLIDTAATLFATPFAALPKFGTDAFGADARTIGFLFSAVAVGSCAAALASGWLRRNRRPGLTLIGCAVAWGAAAAGLGLSPGVVAAGCLLAILGAADTWSEILRAALLQGATPDRMLGRVSSLWLLQATLTPALGNVLVGATAETVGVRTAFLIGGACAVGCALLVALAIPALRGAAPVGNAS